MAGLSTSSYAATVIYSGPQNSGGSDSLPLLLGNTNNNRNGGLSFSFNNNNNGRSNSASQVSSGEILSSLLKPLMGLLGSMVSGKSKDKSGSILDKDSSNADPKSNSGALSLLSEYGDEIGKNGKITQKDLKKFAKRDDLPDDVKKAAKKLSQNDELYSLLVQESGSTPEKGFKTKALDTDWEKRGIDIDELESAGDEADALKTVRSKFGKMADKNGDLTLDTLKDTAKGKGAGKKDRELQAAVLKLLKNPDLIADLDGNDDSIIREQDFSRVGKDKDKTSNRNNNNN